MQHMLMDAGYFVANSIFQRLNYTNGVIPTDDGGIHHWVEQNAC